jgi:hypothetical protein
MEKFARKCSATNVGMNEGYVVNDGDEYFANKSDLVKWLRDRNVDEYNELSDEFLLKEAFELDEFYWTEWDDEDDYEYVMINGVLTEIEE